jgi:hypothetical protein
MLPVTDSAAHRLVRPRLVSAAVDSPLVLAVVFLAAEAAASLVAEAGSVGLAAWVYWRLLWLTQTTTTTASFCRRSFHQESLRRRFQRTSKHPPPVRCFSSHYF